GLALVGLLGLGAQMRRQRLALVVVVVGTQEVADLDAVVVLQRDALLLQELVVDVGAVAALHLAVAVLQVVAAAGDQEAGVDPADGGVVDDDVAVGVTA